MKTYKIEEVMRETGLTKRTLRYYEELGIIQPPDRSEGNIRLYTDADIRRIRLLIEAKEVLGFSLLELKQFVDWKEHLSDEHDEHKKQGKAKPEALLTAEAMLVNQLQQLEGKMKRMQEFKGYIEELLESVRGHLEI
ncbi:MerR family transcriptional regulator [Paenibacillus aquistagni]|uniref:Transcriptional regulator, MerR family n=1 Tax=Paenibacillus aquistagni TaxID=1852522 RepID=A0A1X7L8Y1_9BACL|nr:MerR family transcriptional regulator [Paenibacillus aquistagni]NMM53182.1 MerR family transcriptional regulator [Paenibacillus aquistagni]SMG50200.1 transcriptional regulator, MerR family [Paenibacillus aquistagni]